MQTSFIGIDLLGIDYFLESAGQAIRLYAG